MKKLLSYSIILMTLCALVSCSNDDDNDGGNSGITAKKLLYFGGFGGTNFIYNDKGKLEKANDMTCIWTDNSVECDTKRDGKFTALLSGDKILRISCEYAGNPSKSLSIEYSGDRRTKMTTYDQTQTYKWDGDNITEINYSGYENIKETYTYYPDKKGNETIDLLLMRDDILPYPFSFGIEKLIYAHPWLFGKGNKNLIKSITTQKTSGNYVEKEIVNYTYEFDTNGNPIKVYAQTDDNDQYARYTLLWEL